MNADRKPVDFSLRWRQIRVALLTSTALLPWIVSNPAQGRNFNSSAAAVPAAAAQVAAGLAAQQAAAAGAQAQASLARAAAALAAARKAQQDAAAAAQADSTVANGVAAMGLMPLGGVTGTQNPCGDSCSMTFQLNTPASWQNADTTFTQTVKDGQYTVDITQTQTKAILNWQTFNVGRNTSVQFEQQAADWTVLNRVTDPSGSPTQILGQISAPGGVYVINRNGIIFGAGAQVNVHALVASTLDVGLLGSSQGARDQFFLTTGIDNPKSFSVAPTAQPTDAGYAAENNSWGDVVVKPGASITTSTTGLDNPGFVYLFGRNVSNSGAITVPAGEVALVAARTIDLVSGGYWNLPSAVQPANVTYRGTDFEITHFASTYLNASGATLTNNYTAGTGLVSNDGLIETPRGITQMNGDRITVGQTGVIEADTGITRNSMVLLRAATSVDLEGTIAALAYDDPLTSSLPIGGGAGSSVQSFSPAYVELSAQGSVTVGSTGLISAPSATVALRAIDLGPSVNGKNLYVTNSTGTILNSLFGSSSSLYAINPSVTGPQRVTLQSGATVDVAGLQDVELPAGYNFIAFQPGGNEFADMPLQRDGVLYRQTLWIDIRDSGTRSDGTSWVGTPLADASGAISTVGRSIEQLMTTGGSVSLTTDLSAASGAISDRSVILQPGSVINVAGGKVTFLPGMVPTTVLLGSDGRRYSMANADPNMIYLGIAGQFTVDHARWGIKEIWSTGAGTETYQSGYTEGHDAGGISISTVIPQLLGQMYFGSEAGERQIGFGLAPSASGGVTNTQAKGDELPSQGYLSLNIPTSVVIGSGADLASGQLGTTGQIAPISGVTNPSSFAPIVKGEDFTPTSAYETSLSSATLSSYGLSLLKITANDLLVTHDLANGSLAGASSLPDLSLAAGGTFSATAGGAISIAGSISAPGGHISLVTDAYVIANKTFPGWFKAAQTASGKTDVFIEGVLDVSGRWINDIGRFETDVSGPGFIDGGSISIATNRSDNGNASLDTTGSILLAPGSLLDASSGGYISPMGVAKTASAGVMAGKGGSISLLLYQGANWDTLGSSGPLTPGKGSVAGLELDGTLRAYGFASNGMLTLGAPRSITISSTSVADANSGIVTAGSAGMAGVTLASSRLTAGGFSSYVIESTPDGWSSASADAAITVAAATDLALQQQNLDSLASYTSVVTGSKIAATASRAILPDDERKPVNLTLKSNNILLDTGSAIVTDPLATVSLGGVPDYTKSDPTREAAAQNVLLRGSIIDHAGSVSVNAQKTWLGSQARIDVSGTFVANSLFGLRSDGQMTSGTLLAGGTFSVEAGTPDILDAAANSYVSGAAPTGSYVVAETGALVDVSGYATTVQVQNNTRAPASSILSWSDAGTVEIDAAAFAWGGSFKAMGGRSADGTQVLTADGKTPVANGGTLILGGGAMLLQQSSANVVAALSGVLSGSPATLANLAGKSASIVSQLRPLSDSSSSIFAAVDRLDAFENVFLYSGTAQNGAARVFTGLDGTTYGLASPLLGPLVISGSVKWTADDGLARLYVAASTIGSNSVGSTVTLAAPYMLFTGGGGTASTAASSLYLGFERTRAGDPKSDVIIAQTIDIEGATFAGFNDIEFRSLGDIRLSTPKVADGLTSTGTLTTASVSTDLARFLGQLNAGGADLVLDAQRIYPVSAVDFTIQTTGNVSFEASAGGRSDIPLSAGGSLTVYAATIDQGGNLFAPLGRITLGDDGTASANTSKIETGLVTLEPGSLTSVTLVDTVVPYGETVDGVNWYYNASLHPLLAASSTGEPVLPSKGLVLNGTGVAVEPGATIDTRGGGDPQAMELTLGKGGSRDTLTTTAKGQTVYALVPSYNDPVAAFDIHFTTSRSLDGGQTVKAGDDYPLAGQQIYLDGSNGIPAGTYTLYPAHYATLAGTLRVVDEGSNLGKNIPSGTTLPDGTVLVSGHYTQSVRPGAYSSGSELFAVQTDATWQQYSEYSFTTANSYFVNKASQDGVAVPRLPMDAGRVAVVAQQQLLFAGTALTQPAPGGRGSELDISGSKLAVLSAGVDQKSFANAGYVVLSADQFGSFESILIGGLRSDTAQGTLITGAAADVVIDTPDGFTAPEILIVTEPGSAQQTISQAFQLNYNGTWFNGTSQFSATAPAGSGTITIKTGSVIETSGAVQTGAGRNYYFASPTAAGAVTAQQVAAAVGGTLDSSGTLITGADLNNLPISVPGLGYISNPSVATLANYSYGPGLGALFVATQDPTLSISGPTGTPNSPLTIQFTTGVGFAVRPADGSSSPVSVTLPGADVGRAAIEAGAHITTNSLLMQATATTNSIVLNKPVSGNSSVPAAIIAADHVTLAGRSIGLLGAGQSAATDSVILSQENLAQLATASTLSLKALTGDITLYGSNLYGFGWSAPGLQELTLDARAITGTGGNAGIDVGGTVNLLNSSGSTGTSAVAGKTGALVINAGDIELGGGVQTIAGYSWVNWNSSHQILVDGPGALTLGTGADQVDLQVSTPGILVGAATAGGTGSFGLATLGGVSIVGGAGGGVRPADSSEVGGNLAITASSIIVNSTIQAQAGTIRLDATTGDLRLDARAYLAAGGYAEMLRDVTTYLPGGKVMLQADSGNINLTLGSVIDVAQPASGAGYGGEIDVTALGTAPGLFGYAFVNGELRGQGGPGLGGSFKFDTRGSVDLNVLANILGAGGMTGSIDVHTRTGNLVLSRGQILTANSISLTADDPTWDVSGHNGMVIIDDSTIDARGYGNDALKTLDGSGQAGGQVALYGYNSVVLTGGARILASTEHSDERGGDVTMGIAWGSQSWSKDTATGGIDLLPGSVIDVHGGTKGGLSGGTLTLRAPNDGDDDVKIGRIASTITGARNVTIESFVSFSTNWQGGINASSLGWNGVIDPAGAGSAVVNSVAIPSGGSYTAVPTVTFSTVSGGTQAQGTAVMGLKSISIAATSSWDHLDPNTTADVVIDSPTGGTAATGTVKTDASGVPTFTITNPGSGFTGAPTTISFYSNGQLVVTAHLTGSDLASAVLTVVGVNVTNTGAGYSLATPATVTFSGGGALAAASGTVNLYSASANFEGTVLKQYVEGSWSYDDGASMKSYGFGGAVDRLLKPLAATIGASTVHLQPGVELVNPDQTINGGNITIASNWNLAAGVAGNLQSGKYASGATFSYFDPAESYVDFAYRYLANYGTPNAPDYAVEAGALTLRAVDNINVNASISDGFFQFGDYLDSNYKTAVTTYLAGVTARTVDGVYRLNNYKAAPLAPYKAAANVVSPSAIDLDAADLFPHALNVCVGHCGTDSAADVTAQVTDPGSWSYRLTAGADTASANPNAMQSLNGVNGRNTGDVIVSGHVAATTIMSGLTVNLPTMVRTGTGEVTIDAARDVRLVDTLAPGVIYAAGVNTPTYANPYVVDASGNVSVQNVDGFLEPQVMAYASSFLSKSGVAIETVYGAPTAAAFPTEGGDVSVFAQRDITGYRDVTTKTSVTTLWNAYYTPWLLADAGITPSNTANNLGADVFAPTIGTTGTSIASQTAWWIEYGSFREGFLSAGGNMTVTAGRDLIDVSVSLPTTGRVTGGLADPGAGAVSTPQTHLYGSGNMEVRAGRNLLGGSYYEGSGHATILVGGKVDQNGTLTVAAGVNATLPNYPLLAVDTGAISMVSVGSMAVGGVVNPAGLHQQSGSLANPAGAQVGLLMNTYGPDSLVSLEAVTGNLNIAMPQTVGTTSWNTSLIYPASFEAIAVNGNITTKGLVTNSTTLNPALPGIVLTGSEQGIFELIAAGSVDLTGGYTNLSTAAPAISAGPSLLDAAFDPFQPNNGMTDAFSAPVLAHQDDHDTNPARIYAVSGDISAVGTVTSNVTFVNGQIVSAVPTSYVRVELNRPAQIYAGRDIVNLNAIVENIAADDVTTIEAGRDIVYDYTGAKSSVNQGTVFGGLGLQIAGPGYLVVQAGRDIGPFLPLTRDNSAYTQGQEGIASVGDASLWPVGNRYVAQGSAGFYDTQLLGSFTATTKKRNEELPANGANIDVLFGVAGGINYDGYTTAGSFASQAGGAITSQGIYHPGVIDTYINPDNAANVDHNYLGELRDFLARIGKPVATDVEAWSVFRQLPQDLQRVFADQVFFAELKAVGKAQSDTSGLYQRGYEIINIMFPSDFGYSQNALGGGTNGANVLAHTGDLDMLHASIQTRLGGDISIFGPGGDIRVGSLGLEPNKVLKPNDLGILTLGGGAINTFTDGSVLVNSSRIMTQQGGDILMWSSNGDLDAGRGAQTTLSLPPLQVIFNSDDYQSVDLGGLVSGAGIAVVQSSKLATESNAYLLAPRGTVDAGEAGIRVSGNLVVAAVQVVNAGNIQVGGTSTGIPVISVPNIGALTSASSTAGAASRPAEQPTGAGPGSQSASVFIVEVVGYGGDDGGGQGSNQGSDQGAGQSGSGGGSESPAASDRKRPASQ